VAANDGIDYGEMRDVITAAGAWLVSMGVSAQAAVDDAQDKLDEFVKEEMADTIKAYSTKLDAEVADIRYDLDTGFDFRIEDARKKLEPLCAVLADQSIWDLGEHFGVSENDRADPLWIAKYSEHQRDAIAEAVFRGAQAECDYLFSLADVEEAPLSTPPKAKAPKPLYAPPQHSQAYVEGMLEGMREEGPDDRPPPSDADMMDRFKSLLKSALSE